MTAPGAEATKTAGAGVGGSSGTTTELCARGHDNWFHRPSRGGKFCRTCSNAARRRSRGYRPEPKDPNLCWNQLHPNTPGGCGPCREAAKARQKLRDKERHRLNPDRKTKAWAEVEDCLDLYANWHTGPNLIVEVAAKLNMTVAAVKLHIKRRGWHE